ncbi:26 proteasome complex subunit DSS1 [Capronia epimyces CBS 606.96]|uniref:26S proteasome complex subunit SEM1 n=1 Tax=Capronia epimyces CBS 606.96 TaxID=1182542 RepID=W9XJ47_9EURO|nr:26 proteasome complex subunit DSS1 [Capronia epimyces CBS 606.96]EXJ77345.1 26 proteasome complex subunit DSS1 [Capronia epimyces CBS 606.96]
MSSGSSNVPTTKLQPTQKNEVDPAQTSKSATNPQPALLEEDDEFEDFPVEDWAQEDAEVPGGATHLWEESWDDDDQNEDFSKQLKEELKKVEATK